MITTALYLSPSGGQRVTVLEVPEPGSTMVKIKTRDGDIGEVPYAQLISFREEEE